ncbi:MAG TPA: glycosyltransferase family 4 protein [Ohtaekwangia sp.]
MARILMLGWEFPPLFSGGLGVATYGLVKALSQKDHIRLIIPTAAASDLDNVNITGLNRVTAEEVNLERLKFNFSFSNTEVHSIPLPLSPYHYANTVLSTSNDQDEFERLREGKSGIEVINAIFSGGEVYGMNILHKVYLYSKLAEEISADGNFDVIHAHDWVTFPAGINIRNRTGKPLVLHVHALETDRAGHETRNEIYHLEKTGMEAADRIIAVSQFTKEQIVTHYNIDSRKIAVVHNGIEPVQTTRKEHQLRDKLVAFLGRLTHQKGPQFLIETAEKVTRVYPRVKFVVAGVGDQFAPILESSAYKKLGSKFIFTGFLSKAKVNELLAMTDVYFMPSVSEPFGLTALEAAQYKVPGVISSQSGVAEVMKSSLKADFWDTDKYANYIFALLKYNVLHKTLSDQAVRELDDLTWEHAAKKVQHVYQTVTDL